jgi:transposase
MKRAVRRASGSILLAKAHRVKRNPFEQVFAKPKHLLRKAAERTLEATWKRIGILIDQFQATECANYLINSEYASV